MSKEETIKTLKKLKSFHNGSYGTAIDEAIKALEQQFCEDCISRKMAVEAVAEALKNTFVEYEDIAKKIIGKLPSVTPQRPKGKWIKIQSGDEDFPESIVCSRCKNENSHLDFDEHNNVIGKVFVTSKYCPNCGAKMSGGGEE